MPAGANGAGHHRDVPVLVIGLIFTNDVLVDVAGMGHGALLRAGDVVLLPALNYRRRPRGFSVGAVGGAVGGTLGGAMCWWGSGRGISVCWGSGVRRLGGVRRKVSVGSLCVRCRGFVTFSVTTSGGGFCFFG